MSVVANEIALKTQRAVSSPELAHQVTHLWSPSQLPIAIAVRQGFCVDSCYSVACTKQAISPHGTHSRTARFNKLTTVTGVNRILGDEGMKISSIRPALLAIALVATQGCAPSLNSLEKRELRYYEMTNLAVEEKNVALAGFLGILPGGGSFYTEEYAFGVLNLLLWPASVLWDPFSGINGAQQQNYAATKIRVNRLKADELSQIEEKLQLKQIKMEEYAVQKSRIEKKYKADL